MNDYKLNSACKQEKLLKIIKSDFLSTSMAWDTNNVNDWSNATLQTTLNGDYYGNTGTYVNKGLNSTAQSMVANVVWTLGGLDGTGYMAEEFYKKERSNTVYQGNPSAFVGHVGLMFPSDYGYATGGGSTGRSVCLAKDMYSWDSLSNCYNNDWLYNSSSVQWTLTPNSGDVSIVFDAHSRGSITGLITYFTYGVRPVVYLKSSVQIVNDEMDGSSTKPYNLSY